MSYFDDASLVMIPSGYKDQKVYSVKPIDGTGDLTFTRSNDTASRVASDGLIQKVRTNVFSFSEDFSTSSGFFAGVTGASTATFTANYGTAPDGTATADRIQLELNGEPYADWLRPFAVTTGVGYTYSIYLKSLSGTPTIEFLNDGSVGIQKTLTTDWVRYDYTWTSAGATIYPRFLLGAATSSSADILAWGAMVEVSDFGPTDYIATTSAAVSVGPVANLPRLDYSGGATCPSLKLEPQRTNSASQSEDFNGWPTKVNVTTTANYAVSPDGYTNADRLVFTSNGYMYPSSGVTQTNGVVYTLSCYAKRNGSGTQSIGFFKDGSGVVDNAWTLTSNWQRFTYTYTAGNASLAGIGGISGADVSVYGFQFEIGAYATSYIPTLSAAVTRGVDKAEKTSASALIGQTEGTVYWEIQIDTPIAASNEAIVNIDNGSFGNTIYIYKGASATLSGEFFVSAVSQASFVKTGIVAGTYKCALGYANNNAAFFVNGEQVGTTDTSCSVPTTSRIQMGNTAISSDTSLTKQLLLFKTRLTNAQLAELTTL